MEISFTELRNKEVINVLSGKVLGNICDVIFDARLNCVLGFVVPGSRGFLGLFKNEEIFIPINSVCKIGEDVILVEVIENNNKKHKKNVKIFDFSQSKQENSLEQAKKE